MEERQEACILGIWRVWGQGMRLERQAGPSLPLAGQVMALSLATKSGLEMASLQIEVGLLSGPSGDVGGPHSQETVKRWKC